MQTWNPGMDNIHSEILGLLVEINQHLLCFMAQGVPREDEDILSIFINKIDLIFSLTKLISYFYTTKLEV